VAEEMAYWDDELTRHGAYIVLRRELFAARLSQRAEAVHHLLAGTDAGNGNGDTRAMLRERRPTAELRLNVGYKTDVAPKARAALIPDLVAQVESESALVGLASDEYTASVDASAMRGRIPHLEKHIDAIANEFKSQLEELRGQEIRRGVSVLGPHRDDLLFRLGDLELGAYGSRGQQRTAVLAVKLAEVDLMTDETGDTPILLLDDIMSELDLRRRGYLLSTIKSQQYQALITTTDLTGFDPGFLERASVLEVKQGEVEPVPAAEPAPEPEPEPVRKRSQGRASRSRT
jgi:DNA replication and repair protein RecF